MAEFKDEDFGLHLNLMKRCFFLNIFNPKDKNFFNWNIYRMWFFVFVVITQCVVLIGTYGYVFDTDYIISDIEIVMFMNFIFQNYLILWNYIIFLNKGYDAWEVLFDVSRLNVYKSKRCWRYLKIIYDCRKWIIKVTNIYFGIVCMIFLQWLLYPLIMNFFMVNETMNNRFKLNILNCRFLISIDIYNQYYYIFYALEIAILLPLLFVELYSDVYILSLSLITISHYKILNRAYESIGHGIEYTQIAGKDIWNTLKL